MLRLDFDQDLVMHLHHHLRAAPAAVTCVTGASLARVQAPVQAERPRPPPAAPPASALSTARKATRIASAALPCTLVFTACRSAAALPPRQPRGEMSVLASARPSYLPLGW